MVGAGPTGLTLALQAHDHGARVRIVERRTDPVRPSRAMVLYPRTLEVLRPLGVVEAVLARPTPRPPCGCTSALAAWTCRWIDSPCRTRPFRS